MKCKIEGCYRDSTARELCVKHYARYRRAKQRGDPDPMQAIHEIGPIGRPPKEGETMQVDAFSLRQDQVKWIREKAQQEDRSKSAVVRDAVDHLKTHPDPDPEPPTPEEPPTLSGTWYGPKA